MHILQNILQGIEPVKVTGDLSVHVKHLALDSREVAPGTAFFAIRGTLADGHEYIAQALESGANVIVCESMPEGLVEGVTYIQVESSSKALGVVAANFYGNPSAQLKLVAVTGTNGKTSTVTMLYNLVKYLGYKVGLLSTVRNLIDTEEVPATHTTGNAIQVNMLLHQMVEAGCEYVFMEASSHAIHQHRIYGLEFAGAVFTNISHDHLDYHKTFDAYIAAKKALFDELPKTAFALTNIDDKRGMVMVQNTKAAVKTYSLKRVADFRAKVLENAFSGLILDVDGQELYTRMVGEFNAYNILCVYAVSQLLGFNQLEALTAISQLPVTEGRFDYIISDVQKVVGVVDYAHTPDALKKVLSTIQVIRTGNEQIITVVGCGGNRDKEKRPVMARIAGELSDRVVLTSDNPRNEDPATILAEMQGGLTPVIAPRVITVQDRKEAIKTACMMAQTQDIILVAGKGHEKYQDIGGVKHPFDDKQILQDTLKEMHK